VKNITKKANKNSTLKKIVFNFKPQAIMLLNDLAR